MLTTLRSFWLSPRQRIPEPWTNVLGLGRSLIALSAALTYLLTPSVFLFNPVDDALRAHCDASIGWLAWPCWFSEDSVAVAQLFAGALCLIVASGWWPALTAVPLALLLIALPLVSSAPDGGDQLAGILGLLLLPVSLTDWRRNSWVDPRGDRLLRSRAFVANLGLALVKAQVSVVYLVACLGKLGSPEWADGSALFYWVRNNVFGAPQYLRPIVVWVTEQPLLVTALTWGTLLLEFTLAIAIFLPSPFRTRALLPVAILFHIGIWLVLGVSSFAFVMCGALLFLVIPAGWSVGAERSLAEVTEAGRA